MQSNDIYEPYFRKWLIDSINKKGPIDWEEAIYSGAEVVGCSSMSTERYLRKMTSLEGALRKTKDSSRKWVVEFRENGGGS